MKKIDKVFEETLIEFLETYNIHLCHSETMANIKIGSTHFFEVSDFNWKREKGFDNLQSAIKSARQR